MHSWIRNLLDSQKQARCILLICYYLFCYSIYLHAQVEPGPSGSAVARPGTVSTSLLLPTQVAAGTATATTTSATNITISGQTQVSNAQRLGINIGGQTYYDSGQLLRNLVFRNPGFEAETFRTILHCAAVTATSCTDTNIYAQWPANFVKGAGFEFIYGSALGATGTISTSTAANYNQGVGVTITFPPTSQPPAKGDFVTVSMAVPGNAQAGWWTTANGGASFSTETADLPPGTAGVQALRVSAAGSGQSAEVASYFDSFSGRSFVQLNGTYQLSFRAKGVGGSNELSLQLVRQTAGGNETFFSQNVTLAPTWQTYTFSFQAAEDGSSVGTMALKFDLGQSSMLLDDVSLTPAANTQNPTAFRDEVVSTLQSLHPGVMRYQDANGAGLGNFIDNAIAPPFGRVRTGYSQQETEQDDTTIGLHEFLQLCRAVGANPWYIVPLGVSPTEMQHLVEYLGGAASTPYGAKRAARGQTAPWTMVFPKIYLELGNEVWNDGVFHGAAMPDAVAYGNRASTLFVAARSSASYTPNVFSLVLSSWAAVPWWTSQEMAHSDHYDMVDAAPYLFNSFNDNSSVEAVYGPMFAQPESVDSVPSGSMYQQATAASASGAAGVQSAGLAVYEVQLSTLTGTAPQLDVNAVVPSLGAGLTVVEHMLLMMRDLGVTVQNLYALTEYDNSFANTNTSAAETSPLFGAVVDMGGQTNLKRPIYLAEQLANGAILPNLLTTTLSGSSFTWNQSLSANDSIQLSGAHEIQSFAFSDGGTNRSLIVFNLSRTDWLPVTVSGAGAPGGTIAVKLLTSSNPFATNETGANVVVQSATYQDFNALQPHYLPPFSMTVVTWQASQ